MWKLLVKIYNLCIGKGFQLVEKLEDPTLLTEKGIRDYEEHLVNAKVAQTEIETQVMLNESEKLKAENMVKELDEKIEVILDNVDTGDIEEVDGDNIATELEEEKEIEEEKVEDCILNLARLAVESADAKEVVKDLKATIKKLKSDLKSIKSSIKVLDATEGLNKAKAGIAGDESPLETIKKAQEKMDERKAKNDATKKVASDNRSASDKADELVKVSKNKNSLAKRKAARLAKKTDATE